MKVAIWNAIWNEEEGLYCQHVEDAKARLAVIWTEDEYPRQHAEKVNRAGIWFAEALDDQRVEECYRVMVAAILTGDKGYHRQSAREAKATQVAIQTEDEGLHHQHVE